jgi:hypothetical protein
MSGDVVAELRGLAQDVQTSSFWTGREGWQMRAAAVGLVVKAADLITSQAAEIERLRKGAEETNLVGSTWFREREETLMARAETAERLLAEARAALGDVLDTVSDTLSCGRHCIIEAEAKDEADYAAVIASARRTLTNGGENGR